MPVKRIRICKNMLSIEQFQHNKDKRVDETIHQKAGDSTLNLGTNWPEA